VAFARYPTARPWSFGYRGIAPNHNRLCANFALINSTITANGLAELLAKLLRPQCCEHSSLAKSSFCEFGNLAWPTSAVCFGPPPGTLMLRVLGSAGA
jgi:hypothetical protein